jgi:hypothetical protein
MFDVIDLRNASFEVLDPTRRAPVGRAASPDRDRSTAPRPSTLDGTVLAVIDNRAGRKFVEPLLAKLRARFAFSDVIYVLKDTVNVPPRPEDWREVVKRGTAGLALYGA